MAYRDKVYVSMDADNDLHYYRLMQAWKQNDKTNFNFRDAHDINNILDKSEASIKAGLQERFRHTKVFVLLVGDHTRYLYKYVRWEIEEAIKRKLPCIVVNLNGKRSMDSELCPPIIQNELAIHVSFNSRIMQYALENWPDSDAQKRKDQKTGPYYYKDSVYEKLGL
ncbi:MAG: TIR domain-containing protein [Clostridiales bacterium]|nr:TIR domain-containing protein [Clostridiales bacterium]MCB7512926.1 TIR domain-containing protein [bacterium 210917-SL.2.15]